MKQFDPLKPDSMIEPVSRREFMKLSSLAGVGLFISANLITGRIVKGEPVASESFEPSVYLKINSEGKIIIMAKNPEIGQGVKTSLPQIVAEELEVTWEQIEVYQAPLDRRFGAQFAGGSTAIKTNFTTLRQVGAAAREMLIEAAARQWRVPLNQCFAKEGFVYDKNSQAKLSYGELAAAAAKLGIRENPTLKNNSDFKLIGKSISGVDNPRIVTGQIEFGLDARPKGMLVASIERCPYFGGKLKSYDDTSALKIPGVEKVIRIEPTDDPTRLVVGVAVIAKNTWTAMKGRKALKIEWEMPVAIETDETLTTQLEKNIAGKGEVLRDDGNVDSAWANCKKHTRQFMKLRFWRMLPWNQ